MTRLTAAAPAALLPLLAALLAWAALRPPAVVSVRAPATDFSAARAMATVAAVSRAPHPAGSREAVRVRRLLADRLRGLGLAVSALPGVAAGASSGRNPTVQAGRIETLVATLPGRDRAAPAMAIMTHTDSVPGSFGAADDGVGVAVALETARAVAAGGRPARDLVLILTDGEEAGLLGAQLFFADPARAAQIGALVNIDARGTGGLGTMFETGPGSGGLLARYRSVATGRFAHAAATFLYHRLPNRTDLSALRGLDVPALNFAFLDGEFDYHTPRDALANVDPRTVQSLGDQVLPVVRAVADDPGPIPRGADGVFADAAPVVSIRYPAWVGWPLLALAAALAALGARGAALGASARGAAATLAAALVAALAARVGYALTGVGDDWGAHHRIMAVFGRYEAALAVAALAGLLGVGALLHRGVRRAAVPLACLAGGIVAILLGRPLPATAVLAVGAAVGCWLALGRPLDARAVRLGALAVGLALSLAAQALAPALTPLVLWPTLAAAGGAAAAERLPGGRWVAALLGVVPLAYLLVFGHSMLLALGVPSPEAVGVFVLLAAPLLLPGAAAIPPLAAGIGLALAAAVLFSVRFTPASERYPALSQLYGVVDRRGQGWLVSPLERPDDWTWRQLARGGAAPALVRMPLISADPVWRVPAAGLAVPPPRIARARDGGWTRVTVAPGSGGRTLTLIVAADRDPAAIAVGDRPVPASAMRGGRMKLRWTSPGLPVTLRLRLPAGTRVAVDAAETTEARLALPGRPAAVVAWLGSDRLVGTAGMQWQVTGSPAR